ncbi:hypothetical protein KR018_005848 [Drosophila ironensis]|nr:hypothetical protein KR018_005848 [Drosophila ironensis]
MSSSTSERKRYHKDNAPTDDILTLINLVRQNPALYNYKLQPNQRRRSDVLSGWQEVAHQIGNKYTVQEVRRKWKNLRDTYHQYRLRTPKCIEGRLSKWRYAKELDFLSNVYQPKLKSHRNQGYDTTGPTVGGVLSGSGNGVGVTGSSVLSTSLAIGSMLHLKQHVEDDDDDVIDDDGQSDPDTATLSSHHGASQITLVSDEAETFILTAYEEGVADDSVSQHHHPHQSHHSQHHHHHQSNHHHSHHHSHHQSQHDGSISSIELSQIAHDDDVVDDVDDDDDDVVDHVGHHVDIVKHELDEDGDTGAEVDYEEVCMYEEANGAHVDCEMGVGDGVDAGSDVVSHGKDFHYIDAHDFCISGIEPQPVRTSQHHHFQSSGSSSNATNSVLSGGTMVGDAKLKNLTLVTTTAGGASGNAAPGTHYLPMQIIGVTRTDQLSLVDVTEATSTSATTSSTPAVALNAAIATSAPPATLCNTTSFTATPTTTTLQLPSLSVAGGILVTSCGVNTTGGGAHPLSVSAASSSTNHLVKEEDIQQQHHHHQMAQALAKRDELDLFFDFLKKKMQSFSKTQITHIQMEFLNCVSRQESVEHDSKD